MTKGEKGGKIAKLSGEASAKPTKATMRYRSKSGGAKARAKSKKMKKLEKVLKNPLTNGKRCAIMARLSPKRVHSETDIEN